MGDNMSPADLKAVLGNGTTTVAYPMGGNGFGGFGNGDWSWILLLILLTGGYGFGGGFGGFGGFGMGMDFMYPWLANGQQEIMSNTNNGFDNLHLSNQIEGVRDGINGISNSICSSTASITNAITDGFYGAEISANNRQMADMQQNFNNQISTLQGFNNLNNALQQCCCDNRLATCQTQNIVQNEANATRFADANNTRDIITNATSNTQAILDKLCQLELDGFKRENEQLRSQLQFANMQASQVQQTADLRASQATTANQLVAELRSCPIPAQPVYGNTPIFNCSNNNGCGCNGTLF